MHLRIHMISSGGNKTMKDESHVRQRRAAGARWRPAAILLAAVLVFLSLPLAGKASEVINLDTKCSLTIAPGPASMEAELALSDLQIELYKVADAIPVAGYDTYDWAKTEPTPFGSVVIPRENTNADWKKAAQQAAEAVLGTAREGETEWNPSTSAKKIQTDYPNLYMGSKGLSHQADSANNVILGSVTAQFTDLEPGLYLILAHGESVTDYAAVRSTADDASTDGEGESNIVTLANAGKYEYTFAPELISLPNRPATVNPETGPYNTANRTEWVYNAKVSLKPTQKERVGDLKITKVLKNYEEREMNSGDEKLLVIDDATFVFKVSAYTSQAAYENGDEPTVYNDYVSIVFNDANTKSALVKGLTVGSYVKVEEEYSGRNYELSSDTPKVQFATIKVDETGENPVEVTFENEYDDKHGGGGSVTNKFSRTNDEWNLVRGDDNSIDAAEYEVPGAPGSER